MIHAPSRLYRPVVARHPARSIYRRLRLLQHGAPIASRAGGFTMPRLPRPSATSAAERAAAIFSAARWRPRHDDNNILPHMISFSRRAARYLSAAVNTTPARCAVTDRTRSPAEKKR